MTWFGWLWNRQRQRWQRVCQAEDMPACSRRLGEILRQRGRKEKYATMTGGGVPSFRPAGRRPVERWASATTSGLSARDNDAPDAITRRNPNDERRRP